MSHLEIIEQPYWTDTERDYIHELIGRGIYTVVRTLEDGRFVAVLTETNRDLAKIARLTARVSELEHLLAQSAETARDLRAQLNRIRGGH